MPRPAINRDRILADIRRRAGRAERAGRADVGITIKELADRAGCSVQQAHKVIQRLDAEDLVVVCGSSPTGAQLYRLNDSSAGHDPWFIVDEQRGRVHLQNASGDRIHGRRQ